LAIELDGDSFHGPERWADDMARQAALERAGWVFWRVFGSQWKANPDYWWGRLVERLEQCGIAPIGAAAVNEVYTEHRVIRADGKPVIVPDPEFVATADEAEAADGRLTTSVTPSAPPAPEPELEPAAEPMPVAELSLPSPVPVAAPPQPAPLSPSAAPGQQVSPNVGAENISAESLLVDETGFHLEETQPEIVGPDMAIVLFYPETRNRRTIRISSHDDAPDSNVIHVDRPLARALIGATIDETVELEVSGKRIRIIVEQIYPHLEAAEYANLQ